MLVDKWQVGWMAAAGVSWRASARDFPASTRAYRWSALMLAAAWRGGSPPRESPRGPTRRERVGDEHTSTRAGSAGSSWPVARYARDRLLGLGHKPCTCRRHANRLFCSPPHRAWPEGAEVHSHRALILGTVRVMTGGDRSPFGVLRGEPVHRSCTGSTTWGAEPRPGRRALACFLVGRWRNPLGGADGRPDGWSVPCRIGTVAMVPALVALGYAERRA